MDAEELNRIYSKYKKPDDNLTFSRNHQFTNELRSSDYIGIIGEIVEIRTVASCLYERQTGDIAKYVLSVESKNPKWNGKKIIIYPSQIELYKD